MSLKKQKRDELIQFILLNLREHPSDIVRLTQDEFHLSRTAILRYIHDLTSQDIIDIQGTTKDIRYILKPTKTLARSYRLSETLAEDKIWRDDVLTLFKGIKDNVVNVCQYGFTEIFNNAIEHSEGKNIKINITIWIDKIEMTVKDDGIGIFNNIQKKYKLDDPMHALLELSKGKFNN